jgi:hypothetical protein
LTIFDTNPDFAVRSRIERRRLSQAQLWNPASTCPGDSIVPP